MIGYTPLITYESTRVKSFYEKRPRVEMTQGLVIRPSERKGKLGHNETLWYTLIDIPRGILFDLILGASAVCYPGTVHIEVQQIGAGLDLRNGIVSHRRYSSDSLYDQYKTGSVPCQEFFGRGLIPGSRVVIYHTTVDPVHGQWNNVKVSKSY